MSDSLITSRGSESYLSIKNRNENNDKKSFEKNTKKIRILPYSSNEE
jgi:hypothetical protein